MYADLIADIKTLQKTLFVMKGGKVIRNDVVTHLADNRAAADVHAAASMSSVDAEESPRMAAIRSLGLDSVPGGMQTFYSPHAEARAKGEIEFYPDQFHVAFCPVTMAVLNENTHQ